MKPTRETKGEPMKSKPEAQDGTPVEEGALYLVDDGLLEFVGRAVEIRSFNRGIKFEVYEDLAEDGELTEGETLLVSLEYVKKFIPSWKDTRNGTTIECFDWEEAHVQKEKGETMKKKTKRGQGWTCPHCDGVSGNRASKCKHCGKPKPASNNGKAPKPVGKGPVGGMGPPTKENIGQKLSKRLETVALESGPKFIDECSLTIVELAHAIRKEQKDRSEPASSLSYETEGVYIVLKTEYGARLKVTKQALREFMVNYFAESLEG